jgi:hypothetical protein
MTAGPLGPFTALAKIRRWCGWRNENRGNRVTEVPYSAAGRRAQSSNPKTWRPLTDFDRQTLGAILRHPGGSGGPSEVGIFL